MAATSKSPMRRSVRISQRAAQQEDSNATPNNAISDPVTKSLKRKRPTPQTKAAKSGTRKKQGPEEEITQRSKSSRGLSSTKRISGKLNNEVSKIKKTTAAAPRGKATAPKAAKKAVPSSKQKQKSTWLKAEVKVPHELPHNLGPIPGNAPEELPHNIGPIPGSIAVEIDPAPALGINDSDKENRTLKDKTVANGPAGLQATGDTAATATDEQETLDAAPKTTKTKRPAYHLTPGQTPYPKWPHPTREECEKINCLLAEFHGEAKPPPRLEPSLTVTGCGEVPCVLDALIRTLLSGATSGNNSALAFDGLVKRFGILQEGIGKGSVNWDAVRQAPLKDVFDAIKRGGLADIKSKNLKAILDIVYEENQGQRKRLQSNDGSSDEKHPGMSPQKAEQAKEYEIACAEQHVLSLNHLHNMPTDKVMNELTKYPGIGPKTAACVILFCLQRPCFAVDTHIFRICKWLGWVPQEANEIMAFKHLDVRIPDEYKYSLHQLFIRHGKTCPRCRAITGEKSAGWGEGCPIDDLVNRSGVRKGILQKAKRPRKNLKRKRTSPTRKKKRTKRKTTSTKATAVKRNPARKARPQKGSIVPETTAQEDLSTATAAGVKSSDTTLSLPAPNQEDVTIPARPTAETTGASDPPISEKNEHGAIQATAAEMADSKADDASDGDSSNDDHSEYVEQSEYEVKEESDESNESSGEEE